MGKSRKRQNKLKSTQDPDVSITLSQADTNDFEGDSILQQDKNIEMEAFEHEDSGINLNKKNYKITQVDVNQIIPDEEQENAVENENETQFDEQEQEEEEEEEVESIENGKSNQENEVKNKKITNFDFLEDVEVVENTQKNEEVSEESDDEAPEEITLSKGKQIIEDLEKQKKEYDLNEKKKLTEKKKLKLQKKKEKRLNENKRKFDNLKQDEEDNDEEIQPLPLELLSLAANNQHLKEFTTLEQEDTIEVQKVSDTNKKVNKLKKQKKENSKVINNIKIKKVSSTQTWDLPIIKVDAHVLGFLNEALYGNRENTKIRNQVGLSLPTHYIGPAPKFIRED